MQKEDISRVGVIARNHNGQVIGSLKITRELRGDAFIAEFFAFLQVVNFCIEAGFLNIILESDAQLVVKELKVANLNWIIGALLLQDAKLLLNSIPQWSVQHVREQQTMLLTRLQGKLYCPLLMFLT